MRLTRQQLKAFWSKVDVRGKDDCWIWRGAIQSKGYGSFGIGGKVYGTHRIAWALENGRMPMPDMFILHSCDNRRCCNPAHLREGTHLENMQDMKQRGRGFIPAPQRKLTAEQVKQIRRARGTQKQIAKRFGVHQTTIGQIINNKVWRTLD